MCFRKRSTQRNKRNAIPSSRNGSSIIHADVRAKTKLQATRAAKPADMSLTAFLREARDHCAEALRPKATRARQRLALTPMLLPAAEVLIDLQVAEDLNQRMPANRKSATAPATPTT